MVKKTKQLKFLLIVIFISGCALAGISRSESADEIQKNQQCWQKEINYKNDKKYSSIVEWKEHSLSWERESPLNPGYFNLARAYFIYKSELSKANALSNDKVKHCFIGCKMAQSTNLETVKYVGWYKEKEDLHDCDLNTRFELLDFESTLDGAQIASSASADSCESYCEMHWQNKN